MTLRAVLRCSNKRRTDFFAIVYVGMFSGERVGVVEQMSLFVSARSY